MNLQYKMLENEILLFAINHHPSFKYAANVRKEINFPCDIADKMRPYEKKVSQILGNNVSAKYIYPWNRKFEIEVVI